MKKFLRSPLDDYSSRFFRPKFMFILIHKNIVIIIIISINSHSSILMLYSFSFSIAPRPEVSVRQTRMGEMCRQAINEILLQDDRLQSISPVFEVNVLISTYYYTLCFSIWIIPFCQCNGSWLLIYLIVLL